MENQDIAGVFSSIYHKNSWGSPESRSGPGSGVNRTGGLRGILRDVLSSYYIKTMLDLPCGDFNWMKEMDLSDLTYLGGDIVPDLIDRNNGSYGRDNVKFSVIDAVEGPIPRADLIFCRDMMVHLPFEMIGRVLKNFRESGSRYLLATTFTGLSSEIDIKVGSWRPIDMCGKRIGMPEPLLYIPDHLVGADYRKMMGLWELSD